MSRTISDQIRAAIKKSGMTRYRLSKETGIDQAALSRFVHGAAGLSLEAIDRIGAVLGLEVVSKGTKKAKGK
jgi:transcriptional regulator with XRE-family HTH domain